MESSIKGEGIMEEETVSKVIECYFCDAKFSVNQIETAEEIAFCPFCATEIIDPVDVSCPDPDLE